MPYKRKERAKTNKAGWLLVAAVIAAAAGLWWWFSAALDAPQEIAEAPKAAMSPFPVRPAALGSPRPTYRYSVIRGGVYSQEELQASLRDPVVAAHYADFRASDARIVHAGERRPVYVSYRKGDQVYWTAKRVNLAPAEALITDGHNEARARCGNRISDAPQQPVAAQEPAATELEAVEPPVIASSTPALAPEIFPEPEPVRMAMAELPAMSLTPAASSGESKPSGSNPYAFPGDSGGILPWRQETPSQSITPVTPSNPVTEPPVVHPPAIGEPVLPPHPIAPPRIVTPWTPETIAPTVPVVDPVPVPWLDTPQTSGGDDPGGETGGGEDPPPNDPPPNDPPPDDPPPDVPEPATGLLVAGAAIVIAMRASLRRQAKH